MIYLIKNGIEMKEVKEILVVDPSFEIVKELVELNFVKVTPIEVFCEWRRGRLDKAILRGRASEEVREGLREYVDRLMEVISKEREENGIKERE